MTGVVALLHFPVGPGVNATWGVVAFDCSPGVTVTHTCLVSVNSTVEGSHSLVLVPNAFVGSAVIVTVTVAVGARSGCPKVAVVAMPSLGRSVTVTVCHAGVSVWWATWGTLSSLPLCPVDQKGTLHPSPGMALARPTKGAMTKMGFIFALKREVLGKRKGWNEVDEGFSLRVCGSSGCVWHSGGVCGMDT